MNSNTYIFAGGGTGGHLYPGIAVADELVKLDPEATIVFACSDRPGDRMILDPLGYVVVPQPVRPLTGLKNPLGIFTFLRAWRKSKALAKMLLEDLKPRAVFGLGGFAAGPVVSIATKKKIRCGLLNLDIVPGRANLYLADRVEKIFTQFEASTDYFPDNLSSRIQHTGCPIRSSICSVERQDGVKFFGINPKLSTLLVFGGSALAESLTQAFVELRNDLKEFQDTWNILLVIGKQMLPEAKRAFENQNVMILEYCNRMDLAYSVADLTVCRGGAGTVAELTATKTPAVILPYPFHQDRQQYKNVSDLVINGSAIVVKDKCDPKINAESLRKQLLPILRNPSTLQQMKSSIQSQPFPAAKTIARWLAQ